MVTTRSSKPSVDKEKVKPKEMGKDNDNMEIEKTEEQKAEEKANLVIQDLKAQLKEIERAVHSKEPRVISKVNYKTNFTFYWKELWAMKTKFQNLLYISILVFFYKPIIYKFSNSTSNKFKK